MPPGQPLKKVAVVGSGSAGISALWALNRSYHDVYLYEASSRLGGHTNTVTWKNGKYETSVDTGFIVLNTATYPNFINFLKRVKVDTVPTEMTFGVTRDHGAFEWAGTSLEAVFAQRKNIFSPRMWRMIFDIMRFNQFALDLLMTDDENDAAAMNGGSRGARREETIGEYLDREGYSEGFRDDYLIPMTAAVWSTSPDKCTLDFPAVTLVRFMWNHHLLSTVATRPQWLTLKKCGKSYIDAVMRGFPSNHLFLNTQVTQVTSEEDGRVRVHTHNGKSDVYDHVILATHGDQALKIIESSATPEEKEILSAFKTSENSVVLHSDLSHMPKSTKAWSSWNYLTLSSPSTGKQNIDQVSLTYNMNILQHIPRETFGDVLVTMNPLHQPNPDTIQGSFTYRHPLYTPAAVRAQKLLPRIQNKRGISYAGAWTKYGFHEDGFSSGLQIAQDHLYAKLPFQFVDSTYSRGRKPSLGIVDLLVRLIILVIQIFVIKVSERAAGAAMRVITPRANARRAASTTPPKQTGPSFGGAPSMEQIHAHYKRKNATTAYYTLSVILGTVALSYGSVPLYKMICATTGWGGQPIRAHGPDVDYSGDGLAARLVPVTSANRIRVTFNSSVSDTLPWKFTPQQREVRVLPGETALAFYTATNTSDTDIIGVATYSVTPGQVAPYFSKIQCFCFEEQRLNAGETVDMPVFFYLDPDIVNDVNMKGIETVTLNYTFFKAKYDDNGKFKAPKPMM
ncbi:Cytochrome c oxidase assembly protein COX11 [Colletotrichum orbiculare MAFF 240422]|uniref:Cytochrome c oxidase assembly protein COX11 n=1 Tax=Colletotrichum orbiculare (strain 104-T / ATCC 96160 / CBS 514.97 / LARS 414 / MAFF 240422) TaxID=1213857 RepID=A0A484G5V6_COLOR|nr:Cytochrome c oxidase assembly protein COX11 [Colletotrichum orbiculare MAFF 240422]